MHGYHESVTLPHRVNEKRQAATTIGLLAKRAVDLSGRDQRVGIRRAHPVHGGADIAI